MIGNGLKMAEDSGRTEQEDAWAEAIVQHIERKACGRIYDLRVDCAADQIVLQGSCRTYHAKQLAQQAALDVAEAPTRLINEIIVV